MALNRPAMIRTRKERLDRVPAISLITWTTVSLRLGGVTSSGICRWVPMAETRMASSMTAAAVVP